VLVVQTYPAQKEVVHECDSCTLFESRFIIIGIKSTVVTLTVTKWDMKIG